MRSIVVLLAFLTLLNPAVGQTVDSRFSPNAEHPDLLEAALVASDVADVQRRSAYRHLFNTWVDELRVSGRVVGSTFDRARAVHEFLHARALKTFAESATTLDAVFDAGRFNCISSLILYRCLAARFDLRAEGIEVPGHAYAVVRTEAGPLVVQTTCPNWFTVLGDDALRRRTLVRTLGAVAASTADQAPSEGRALDDVGLTAIVYYNRGLDHLEAGRFAESLVANQTALRLDPRNTAARANLLATLNNWSLDRYRRGDTAGAVRLLEQGLAVDPNYALFRENLAAVRRQAVSTP